MAEKADRSNGTIVSFVNSDDSRRDKEMCWLLDVRSLTNLPDSVISSPKTKGSVADSLVLTIIVTSSLEVTRIVAGSLVLTAKRR